MDASIVTCKACIFINQFLDYAGLMVKSIEKHCLQVFSILWMKVRNIDFFSTELVNVIRALVVIVKMQATDTSGLASLQVQ